MLYLVLAVGAVVFGVCFKLLDIVARVRAVIAAARQAHGILRSESLTDEAKEAAIQKAAIRMAGSGVALVGRLALCLLVLVGAVWLGAQSGAYTAADALAAASDWRFIIASSGAMIAALIAIRWAVPKHGRL
jgi:hypothetical protein